MLLEWKVNIFINILGEIANRTTENPMHINPCSPDTCILATCRSPVLSIYCNTKGSTLALQVVVAWLAPELDLNKPPHLLFGEILQGDRIHSEICEAHECEVIHFSPFFFLLWKAFPGRNNGVWKIVKWLIYVHRWHWQKQINVKSKCLFPWRRKSLLLLEGIHYNQRAQGTWLVLWGPRHLESSAFLIASVKLSFCRCHVPISPKRLSPFSWAHGEPPSCSQDFFLC